MKKGKEKETEMKMKRWRYEEGRPRFKKKSKTQNTKTRLFCAPPVTMGMTRKLSFRSNIILIFCSVEYLKIMNKRNYPSDIRILEKYLQTDC